MLESSFLGIFTRLGQRTYLFIKKDPNGALVYILLPIFSSKEGCPHKKDSILTWRRVFGVISYPNLDIQILVVGVHHIGSVAR